MTVTIWTYRVSELWETSPVFSLAGELLKVIYNLVNAKIIQEHKHEKSIEEEIAE
jgi:hypothetical protein